MCGAISILEIIRYSPLLLDTALPRPQSLENTCMGMAAE